MSGRISSKTGRDGGGGGGGLEEMVIGEGDKKPYQWECKALLFTLTNRDRVMGTYLSVRNKGNAPVYDNVFVGQGLVFITLSAANTYEAAVEEEQRRSWVENVPKDMVTCAT